jgi:hypothetical protein
MDPTPEPVWRCEMCGVTGDGADPLGWHRHLMSTSHCRREAEIAVERLAVMLRRST